MPEIKKYLNRDGLAEYNSLLPHSGAEMQTYVSDWLDEHPEATTTVQDGAITAPKLADKSVSLRTLADDTVHMLKGAILTGNLSGEVLTADDAYYAPPVTLTVEGKSTQDGTPTPDAPVEIVSLEQANIHFDDINVLLNLTQALRSVPNGTHDALSFAYLRPSTREGWAWYTPIMVQNVTPIILNGILPSGGSYTDYSFNVSRSSASPDYAYIYSGAWDNAIRGVGACDKLVLLLESGGSGSVVDTDSIGNGSAAYRIRMLLLATRLGIDWDADNGVARTRKFNAWIVDNPITALCKLATPLTTQLDPVELPFTAAPDFTVWNNPNTGLQIEYVRDSNLVIQRIEQAIADQ